MLKWSPRIKGDVDPSGTREPLPAGLLARGKNKLAFNSKAAAAAHVNEILDIREAAAKAELKTIRAERKKLKAAP